MGMNESQKFFWEEHVKNPFRNECSIFRQSLEVTVWRNGLAIQTYAFALWDYDHMIVLQKNPFGDFGY